MLTIELFEMWNDSDSEMYEFPVDRNFNVTASRSSAVIDSRIDFFFKYGLIFPSMNKNPSSDIRENWR